MTTNLAPLPVMGIANLPDELLIMIFDELSGKENMRISTVCKNWFKLINNSSHLMRKVLFHISGHLNPFLSYITLDAILNAKKVLRHYRHLFVSFVNFEVSTEHMIDNPNIIEIFSKTKTVKMLMCQFDNNLLMQRLLQHFGALDTLLSIRDIQIHDWIEPTESVIASNTVPKYELKRCEMQNAINWTILKVVQTMPIIILENSLELDGTYKSEDIDLMCRYLLEHYTSTKELKVTASIPEEHLDRMFRHFNGAGENFRLRSFVSLDLMKSNSRPNQFSLTNDKDFKEFFKQQTDIKKLHFALYLTSVQVYHITDHLVNLYELKLTIDYKNESCIVMDDLNRLKSLKALRKMKLVLVHCQRNVVLNIQDLQNLEHMAVERSGGGKATEAKFKLVDSYTPLLNLKAVIVTGLGIEPADLQSIFKWVPNAMEMKLWNTYLDPDVRVRRTPNNAVGSLIHMDSFIIDFLWVTDAFLYEMKLPRLKRFNWYENPSMPIEKYNKVSTTGLSYLAENCPQIYEIHSSQDGLIYAKSKRTNKFLKAAEQEEETIETKTAGIHKMSAKDQEEKNDGYHYIYLRNVPKD